MTEQLSFNVDAAYDERAEYVKDMAAVEAYERKRQREQDGPEEIDPEVIAEWEAQDAVDSCGYFPEDDFGYDPDEYDEE